MFQFELELFVGFTEQVFSTVHWQCVALKTCFSFYISLSSYLFYIGVEVTSSKPDSIMQIVDMAALAQLHRDVCS